MCYAVRNQAGRLYPSVSHYNGIIINSKMRPSRGPSAPTICAGAACHRRCPDARRPRRHAGTFRVFYLGLRVYYLCVLPVSRIVYCLHSCKCARQDACVSQTRVITMPAIASTFSDDIVLWTLSWCPTASASCWYVPCLLSRAEKLEPGSLSIRVTAGRWQQCFFES
jgi:hypothetical protein